MELQNLLLKHKVQIGRCRIRVQELHGTKGADGDLPWANPQMDAAWGAAPNIGALVIPRNTSKVYYRLINLDLYTPVFFSVPVSTPDKLTAFLTDYPNRYGAIDSKGNKFEVSLVDDSIKFTLANGVILDLTGAGVLTLTLPSSWNVNSVGDGVIDVGTVLSILSNLAVTGNITATLDIEATGDVSDLSGSAQTMAAMRAIFNAHVHTTTAVTGGGGPVGVISSPSSSM